MLNQTFEMPMSNEALKKTTSAFVWTNILHTPFWAMFNMLPFILYKDLHASTIHITAIIILKPSASLLSLYWCSLIDRRKDRLISNLIWARIIGLIPFFFFPFIDSAWFYIFAFGLSMTLHRGTVPAWMEILKINLPATSREKTYTYGSSFSYFGTGLIPFALGWLLDSHFQAWRWIFPITACFSLAAIYFVSRIPISLEGFSYPVCQRSSLKEQIIKPWKSAWNLLKQRTDFAKYQVGFMLGGSGLIIMQPALPMFFIDVLNLSYTELAVALTFCKGVGFILSSPSWAHFLRRIDIYRFNGWITVLAFIFPFSLICAQYHLSWLYGGYFLYGIMQAGSEMSWNLSGPLFSRDEDSSVYSSINILTVGLRGCFVPILGSLLCSQTNSIIVMMFGSFLCLLATLKMFSYGRKSSKQFEIQTTNI